jgi:xanthine dehydrogenase accessory factor
MREVLAELVAKLAAGAGATYCRLVETRGSTPQKPGAVMLVYADGSQAGTLGGGCVEAEVKRRALAALADGRSEIATFTLDSDYGWDDGLICGGRMKVLVEPLTPDGDTSYFLRLHRLLDEGRGSIEAIAFDSEKSGISAPACYLFDAHSQLVAARHHTSDVQCVPPSVLAGLPDLATRCSPSANDGIAYLPNLERCRLLIVGAGHVGQAVAEMADNLEFDVWVVDDRRELLARERFPRAKRVIDGPIGETLAGLPIDANAYCLIVTRGHNHDEEALYQLVNRGARYVGMIGSRRKIKLIFDDLLTQGVSQEALDRVYAPVGIDIGSQTVPEIAVSIVAELIAHRNKQGDVPGKGRK